MFKQLVDAICFRLINGPLSGPTTPQFEISKMEIGPGDFLVLRFKRSLSREEIMRLRESVEEVLPHKNKVLVFEGEVNLSVLKYQPDRAPIAA